MYFFIDHINSKIRRDIRSRIFFDWQLKSDSGFDLKLYRSRAILERGKRAGCCCHYHIIQITL